MPPTQDPLITPSHYLLQSTEYIGLYSPAALLPLFTPSEALATTTLLICKLTGIQAR